MFTDPKTLILFINTFANLALGIIVWFRNRKSEQHIVFIIFASSIALWSFGLAMFFINADKDIALFWAKILYFAGSFIALSLCYFSFIFPIYLLPNQLRRIKYILIIPSIYVFIVTLATNYVLNGIIFEQNKGITYSTGYVIWLIHFISFMSLAFFNLFLQLKKSVGIQKLQVKYILIGTLSAALFGVTTNVILPTLGNFRFFSIGPLMTISMAGFIAYSMVKHRFLDISLAIRSILIFLTSSLIVTSIGFTLALLTGLLNLTTVALPTLASIALIAILVTALFPKIFKLAASFWDTLFFGRTMDYQQSLLTLSEQLSKVLELSKLAEFIIETLMKTMGLSRAAVLVSDFQTKKFSILKTVGFNEHNGISTVEDNYLTQFLKKTQKIIVLEELEKISQESTNQEEKQSLIRLIEYMRHIEAGLIIPIMNNSSLLSLIVLGNKKGGDAYTVEDLKLLGAIASQASVGIINARLYQQVYELSRNLQTKVDEAIKEISKKNDDLKEANIQIGLTGKLKEDLLAMASHEFRTPLSNMKNMLWMLQKQDFIAKLNDNEKQKFDRLSKAVERLDYVVKNIYEMLRVENGNLENQLHFDSVQIEKIIKEIIEDREIEAKDALINLVYQEPQNLLPSVEADPVKLQYCLYELVTNSLKYTDKNGSITITTELQNDVVVIKISDTGKGIPPEHIPTLFRGFDKIDVIHTSQSGMGLGLYIVAKIIGLHKGKINVESTVGKGTTFTIVLPAQKAVNNDIQPINKPPEL